MIKFKAVYSNPNDSWAIKKNYIRNVWASNEINATKLFKEVYSHYDLIKIVNPYNKKRRKYVRPTNNRTHTTRSSYC